MKISSGMTTLEPTKKSIEIKPLYTQKISKEDALKIREQINENANAMAFNSAFVQGSLTKSDDMFAKEYEDFQNFLKDIGYNGKPIAQLSKTEAAELVAEDGFFGIEKTAQRIADFVINGAAGDEGMLRAGREGMLRGFKEAEEIWGGELSDISQQTIQRATELVDKAMYDLGFSIIDEEA